MADTWTHLVRFYHHAIPTFGQLVDKFDGGELQDTFKVKVATGNPVNETIKYTGEVIEVVKEDLLAPVANVPIVINTGLNYRDHIEESQFSVPDLAAPIPYIFYRPAESIAAPFKKAHKV